MRSVIGVDGCRSGWLAVHSQVGFECEVRVHRTFREVWAWGGGKTPILVDVPIGLTEAGEFGRTCDWETRRRLGSPRAASVFTPPVRSALAACSWQEAAQVQQRFTGKRLSRQAWGIAARIREVDRFLQEDPKRQCLVREVHPELLFWSLNGQRPMRNSKKRGAGREERLAVLTGYWPGARGLCERVRREFRGEGVAADDVLDALVCVVAARACAGCFRTLPEEPPLDSAGLRMEILYPDLSAH